MPIAARIDEFGKPAWIALMILGFIWWWPLGLAVLAFMIGSGRMGPLESPRHEPVAQQGGQRAKSHQLVGDYSALKRQSRIRRYRADTLRRLEEEQQEFLKRLRFAKDRAEFDQFMAERRNRPSDNASQPQSQP
jgi:hypothetical protein